MKVQKTSNNPHPEWLMGGNPNAIEAQEAEGQKELINSQQLPLKCNSPRGIDAMVQYGKMGIQVIGFGKADSIFGSFRLPEGWKKEATDHSMWSKLFDAKGRERASIFYKAAFYDRDAFVNFSTRYNWSVNYDDKDTSYSYVIDNSTGEIIFKTDKMSKDSSTPNYFELQDKQHDDCKQFLDTNFPNHKDINAYWD